jgi:hypothetical protein
LFIGITSHQQDKDIFIVKTTNEGEKDWEIKLGGILNDWGVNGIQISDNGYLIIAVKGYNYSVSPYILDYNCWLLKLSSQGTLEWNISMGNEAILMEPSTILKNQDGIFLFLFRWGDTFVVKIEENGNFLSSKTIGVTLRITDVCQTSNGGYAVLTGRTIRRFNASFEKEWDRSHVYDAGANELYSIIETKDLGFMVTGRRVLLKTNATGHKEWDNTTSQMYLYKDVKGSNDYGYIKIGTRNLGHYWLCLNSSGIHQNLSTWPLSTSLPPSSTTSLDLEWHLVFLTSSILIFGRKSKKRKK